MPEAAVATTEERVRPPELTLSKLSPGPGMSSVEVAAHQRARIHGAMLKLVAERGYEAVTVRELARLAKVSSKACYEIFGGKEDCFLRTYEVVARDLVKRLIAAETGVADRQERIRRMIETFLREMARDPQIARLVLIEAHGVGPVALDLIRRTRRTFEERVAADLACTSDGADVPLIARGIVAGVVSVAQSRVQAGAHGELAELADPLSSWALSYRSGAPVWQGDRSSDDFLPGSLDEPSPVQSSGMANEGGGAWEPLGDRALLLGAVQKLAATRGYSGLTARAIRDAAGLSLQSFAANFDSVDECFTAALEQRSSEAFDRAARARSARSDWAAGICQAIASLCDEIASDPVFAKFYCDVISAAGGVGIACRTQLRADLAARLRVGAPADAQLEDPGLEASIGAAWGLLDHCVAEGESWRAPQLVPALGYVLLAPVIGDQRAIDAIIRRTSTSSSQ